MWNKLSLKHEQGASSILVIIMMVVLLVFGLAVLTTSLSNVRLGDRKKAWLYDHYDLEGYAMAEIAKYDQVLAQAQGEAIAYAGTDDFLDSYFLEPAMDDETVALYELGAFMELSISGLIEAIDGNEDATLYYNDLDIDHLISGGDPVPMALNFSVALPDSSYDKHLLVTMEVPGADGSRYTITKFVQGQGAFDYEESLDFGDPFEEDSVDGNPFAE